jgi:methyl-accepting chemotaxis protein
MHFLKLSTRGRVAAGFAAAVVVAAVVGAIAVGAALAIEKECDDIAAIKLPQVQAADALNIATEVELRSLSALMHAELTDSRMRSKLYEDFQQAEKDAEAGKASLDALPRSDELKPIWTELRSHDRAFGDSARELLTLLRAHDQESQRHEDFTARAWPLYIRALEAMEPLDRDLDALGAQVSREADAARSRAAATSRKAVIGAVLATALGVLVIVIVGVWLTRRIGRALQRLQDQAAELSGAVLAGRLDARADPAAVDPEFRGISDGLNRTMEAFSLPIKVTSEYVDRISKGDVPEKITETYQGDFNRIKNSLNGCIDAINSLVTDAKALSAAAVEGKLSIRADASKHAGEFRAIVQGVNDAIDAIVAPFRVVADYCERISHGDLPPRWTAQVHGDVIAMQDSLNRCVDTITAVVADTDRLAQAAVEGKLGTRVDVSKHEGAFRKTLAGVNGTLDAVIGPLTVAAKYVERISKGDVPEKITAEYRGEFNLIKENLNTCIAAVGALVSDARGLAAAAVEGKLSTRADATRHQGDFRKIVEGVNGTLDAVMKPIEEAAAVLEKLAARDLTVRMKGSYQGDHARIKEALNGTAEALHEAMAQVAQAVGQVSAAAGQIASSSHAVADGASEQASALEETSSSLESMSTMTKQAADNAQQASALARTARASATDGAAAMEQMSGAMAKIRASAESTSQIIKDINEVAFQTNLLALNAAVEAARAGEAGRGFAVVAEEVRSLALRSKEAANKTEVLIRESVKQAGEGETTSRHVSGKLGEIVGAIGKVTDIVAEIAASAKEEAAGIDQVTKAVGQMDQVVQQNASNSEEASSSALELSGQAEELAALVGSFQLDRGGQARVPARVAAPVLRVAPKKLKALPPPARRTNGKANALGAIPLDHKDVIPFDGDVQFKDS